MADSFYIAVAEDNESAQRAIQRAARRAFSKDGVNVAVIAEADTFINSLLSDTDHTPGLILLDITLLPLANNPPKDGWDIFEVIKKVERLKAVPTFFFSTSRGIDDIRKAENLGADGYIVKPSGREMEALFEKLKEKYFLGQQVDLGKVSGVYVWN